METSTVRHETPECIAIDATVTKDGHDYTAGGGYVSRDLVYAYVADGGTPKDRASGGALTRWDGTRIGHWHTVSRYRRYGSQLGAYTMHCIVASIAYGPAKGTYHGRYNEDWSQLVALRRSKES